MHRMKKMKKVIVLLCTLAIFLLTTGFREDETKVYDNGDLLSESAEEKLQSQIIKIAKRHKLDIVILTTTTIGDKKPAAYADDFYDDNEFGYEGETGILLLINIGERDVYISTAGSAIQAFSDRAIDKLLEDITPALSDGDYEGGCFQFLKSVDNHLKETTKGFLSKKDLRNSTLIALAVAAIVVLIGYSGHKTKVSAGSHTYLKDRKYDVRERYDHFTHTTTVTRRIERDSSSGGGGGGSSSHTSSSGSSHGGGGGKF